MFRPFLCAVQAGCKADADLETEFVEPRFCGPIGGQAPERPRDRTSSKQKVASFADSCTTVASSGYVAGGSGLPLATPVAPPGHDALALHAARGDDDDEASASRTETWPSFEAPSNDEAAALALPADENGDERPVTAPIAHTFEEAYELSTQVLGTGASGSVKSATCRRTGRTVAVKCYSKETMSAKELRNMRREVGIHKGLAHPNIVKVEDVLETSQEVIIVMECLQGGELFDHVVKHKMLSERETADLVMQILHALEHLHEQHVCHRDIKLENLVFAEVEGAELKLIDFGFAANLEFDDDLSVCGTVQYVAPEVIGSRPWDERSDLWSVGSVAYTMLTGARLFAGGEQEVIRKNKSGAIDFSRRFGRLSCEAQDFLRGLLCADPSGRLSASEALAHPWLQQQGVAQAHSVVWAEETTVPEKAEGHQQVGCKVPTLVEEAVEAAGVALALAGAVATDAAASWRGRRGPAPGAKPPSGGCAGGLTEWAASTLTVIGVMRPHADAYGAL